VLVTVERIILVPLMAVASMAPACLLDSKPLGYVPNLGTDTSGSEDADQTAETETFAISSYECDEFSPADGSGPGGGQSIRICGSTEPETGYMTIIARQFDDSPFDNRSYQVRVSSVGDDPCGPLTWFFVISNSDPVGIGTPQLVFSFPSQWLPGQEKKAYCVTASTQPGDPGYDGDDPQQQSWRYSDKLVLVRASG
jgi:hypothetical protein